MLLKPSKRRRGRNRLRKSSSKTSSPQAALAPISVSSRRKKLHRQAVVIENLAHGFDGETLFKDGNLIIPAGQKMAIIGENGAGKSTFLRCLVDAIKPNEGKITWAENASIGYCPQDSTEDFDNDMTIFEWMTQWRKPTHDDLIVRATLGRLLFPADDAKKKVKVCSGGEKNRLLFGKMIMQDHNVLIMDEPTNHMDMEAIEALNLALEYYEGTLIFVSHDREFVSSLAERIVEIKDQKLNDYQGSYDDFLATQLAAK